MLSYKQCYSLVVQTAEREGKRGVYSAKESKLAQEVLNRKDVKMYPVLQRVYDCMIWTYQSRRLPVKKMF